LRRHLQARRNNRAIAGHWGAAGCGSLTATQGTNGGDRAT
jgi:hypothetical protein